MDDFAWLMTDERFRKSWEAAGTALARVLPSFVPQPVRPLDRLAEVIDAKAEIARVLCDDVLPFPGRKRKAR